VESEEFKTKQVSMERQPLVESTEPDMNATRRERPVDTLKRAGRFLMLGLAGAAFYALVVGPRNLAGLSDGLFIAGAILMVIGLVPWLSQTFSRATTPVGQKDTGLQEILEKQRERSQRTDPTVLLLSISGIIMIVFSFVVGSLVS
jgi:hypothetical protein